MKKKKKKKSGKNSRVTNASVKALSVTLSMLCIICLVLNMHIQIQGQRKLTIYQLSVSLKSGNLLLMLRVNFHAHLFQI